MLQVGKIFQQVEQLLWISLTQLLCRHDVSVAVVRAEDTILEKILEASTLVFLGIIAILQYQVYILSVSLLVCLGIAQHMLQQLQGCRHILA